MAPGNRYPTRDAAGIQAIRDINPRSIAEGVEYGGRIYRMPDGDYSYTEPNRGSKAKVSLPTCNDDEESVGMYHTHGADDDEYENEVFSGKDYDLAYEEGVTSYLGTPSGDIKVIYPRLFPGNSGTTAIIGIGAK